MYIRSFFLLLSVLSLVRCSNGEIPTDSEESKEWRLVWSDEFDIDGLPDEARWAYDLGFSFNNEVQYYTSRPENARIADGHLIITARKEKYNEGEYTSARLKTQDKADWRYCRVEVRAKLPTGKGMWPAIWMLGSNITEVGWPACGELDIMENVGFDPNVVHANIHTAKYNHIKGTNIGNQITISAPYNEFHIYSMEWFSDRIDFYVDDKKYLTFSNEGSGTDTWPFDKAHFLILNAAVGGDWGGQQGIDDTIFPQELLIDYVRIYQK